MRHFSVIILGTAVIFDGGVGWGQGWVRHADLQAVDEEGHSTLCWTNAYPFRVRGVWLYDSEDFLGKEYVEGAESPSEGGQFQVFIQAVDEGDRGGTALYMAQRGFLPGQDYGGEGWSQEWERVTHDPATGHGFEPGDLVEVTANVALGYGGKVNINEGHRTNAANNFTVTLVEAGYGLPAVEVLTAADLVGSDGAAIFDAGREAGGEHWQGMRVRLDGVRLRETNHWCATNGWGDRLCLAEDGSGRTFPLRLPRRDLGAPPGSNQWLSVVGVLNQEGGMTNGYEVMVQCVGPELCWGEGGVVIPDDYGDFTLEYSESLAAPDWRVVEGGVGRGRVGFYRLRKVVE